MRKTYWQVLWSNQLAPVRGVETHWKVGGALTRCAETLWVHGSGSFAALLSSVAASPPGRARADTNPQTVLSAPPVVMTRLWEGALLLSPTATDFFSSGLVLPPRDDVFVCREALLHDRVSGRQGEPSDGRGSDPSHGSKLLQPDDGCLNEQLPGATGPVPLPDPGPGVPRDGRPPLPHRGSTPARRLPPTASALLRDATPRPAQLLPLGAPEQVLWTQVSR